MATVEAIKALRALLLPLPAAASTEAVCADLLEARLGTEGVSVSDLSSWVSLRLGEWRDTSQPPASLVRVVKAIILGSGHGAAGAIAGCYFDCHEKLLTDFFYTHDQARWFLTHAPLIFDLSQQQRMTAAQIANLLISRDARSNFSRQSVGSFLEKVGHSPSLTDADVNRVFDADVVEEPSYFADAGMEEAAELIAVSAAELGFPTDIAAPLKTLSLVGDNITKFVPYIQMLHYQCTIAEFFDHQLTDLYEFRPRGTSAATLFNRYPAEINDAGNPFLNNAKAVERADGGWVRMKKSAERPGTMALQEVLAGLEGMGFAARRELSWLLRLWCQRFIRLSAPLAVVLPNSLTPEQWEKLLKAVANGNTSTYGILEQRVVDAIAAARHPETEGWRSRGLGSSVNASNISQKKLGDCEFQSADDLFIRAYESHGGALSSVYVDDHLRTLRKTLAIKRAELDVVADPADWDIKLEFVAHDIEAAGTVRTENIDGLEVWVSYSTFATQIESRKLDEAFCSDLDQHVLRSASEARTPHEVRTRILDIVS